MLGKVSSLCFGLLYHITFLKRRPIMKDDFWCSRTSSEACQFFKLMYLTGSSSECCSYSTLAWWYVSVFYSSAPTYSCPLCLSDVCCLASLLLLLSLLELPSSLLWLSAWLPGQLLCHCLSAILSFLPPLPTGATCTLTPHILHVQTNLITFPTTFPTTGHPPA